MQFPITIGLHRSRILDAVILLLALIAGAAILAFPTTMWIQIALLVVDSLVAALAWQQLTPRISRLRLERSGEIAISDTGSDAFEGAKILHSATVHPGLTVFRFKTCDALVYTVIVTVDSLKAADFRCLRVFLRWRAEFSLPDDDA